MKISNYSTVLAIHCTILHNYLAILLESNAWGPLPVETRGTGPPNFRLGGQQWFWPPHPILEVCNNSNLENNEVCKKLTTKLASMKYHITETLSDITC